MNKAAPYDSADFLRTPRAIKLYMDEALASGDIATIVHALGVVARAKSMSKVAEETGLTREGLYRGLKADGNPSFDTVYRVMSAVGLQISTKRMTVSRKRPRTAKRTEHHAS